MNHLEDSVLVFHETADCPGLICSDAAGLRCAECGESWELSPWIIEDMAKLPAAAVQAIINGITSCR